MSTTILDALPDEQVLHANSLAVVTPHCILLTNADGRTQTVVAVSGISRIKRVTISYPILLVIASGTLILALAALCSKEGDGAGLPLAIFGSVLLLGYFLSRRGAVAFTVGSEVVETIFGTPSEAADLISAIASAQRLDDASTSRD